MIEFKVIPTTSINRNDDQYLEFYSRLYEGDLVLIQIFNQKSTVALSCPFESWNFTYGRINSKIENEIVVTFAIPGRGVQCHKFGMGVMLDSDGSVDMSRGFPTRIIPVDPLFAPSRVGEVPELDTDFLLGTNPCFEPNWCGKRFLFSQKLPHLIDEAIISRERNNLMRSFVSYCFEGDRDVFVVFPGDEVDNFADKILGTYESFEYMYSEDILV